MRKIIFLSFLLLVLGPVVSGSAQGKKDSTQKKAVTDISVTAKLRMHIIHQIPVGD
jgi:hypothetical protein